jgi:O-antigen ligase
MLAVIVVLIVILAVSLNSEIHALGLWLVVMMAHNLIVFFFGSSAEHLPLYAGVIILATILARKKWTGVPANLFGLLISLYVMMVVAAILAVDPGHSLSQILSFLKSIVLAILVAGLLKSHAQIRCLAQYCLIGVLLAVCVTFFEDFTGIYFNSSFDGPRPGGFAGNPNGNAAMLLAGIPFAIYSATHSKSLPYTVAQYLLTGLIVGAVVLTQSRGGFVILVLLLLLMYIKRPSLKASVVGVAILSAMFLFAPADSDYWERIGTLVTFEEKGTSLDDRKYFVKAGIQMSLDNPVLGVGMGNFGRVMIAANPKISSNPNRSAHNMYIEFLAENGMVGWLLLMTLLGVAVLRSIQYDKRNKSEYSNYGLGFCVAMSLLSLLISGLFHSIEKSAILWFLVGMGFAFQQITNTARASRH